MYSSLKNKKNVFIKKRINIYKNTRNHFELTVMKLDFILTLREK